MIISAVRSCVVIAACLTAFAGPDAFAATVPPAVQAAIQSAYSRVNAAFTQHDLNRFMTFFTPD